MINKIIELSARHRGIVILLAAAAALVGAWQLRSLPLDALPDLADTQVVLYSRWDQAPGVIEDHVNAPLIAAMLGTAGVRAVRGIADYGHSFVYVLFDDGTDPYWARARVLESLAGVMPRLPQGVKTELAPNTTSLGWVFQYALTDPAGKYSLSELRSQQDWYVRTQLKSVPGVADVATVGGYVLQYQVNVDPNRLNAYGLNIREVREVVRAGSSEVSGRLIEAAGAEYLIRGRGYARSVADFADLVVKASPTGVPIRVRDVAQVTVGPDLRRGVADLDGRGEVVSGIVLMRQGENALSVIDRVKARLGELERTLPEGMTLAVVYDRSELIRRCVDTLRWTLAEIMLTVAVVIFVFLRHFPSAVVPIVTIPAAVLTSMILIRASGVSLNIMSMAGSALAMGALVDAAIVLVEQTHRRLEEWDQAGRPGSAESVIVHAMKQVSGPSCLMLLLMAASFLPVLALEAEEGRLFRPLVVAKSLAVVVAAVLSITLAPALRLSLARGTQSGSAPRAAPVEVIDRGGARRGLLGARGKLVVAYGAVVRWTLAHKLVVIGIPICLMLATLPLYKKLGWEFMPPFDEGTLLYMPSTLPGISIGEAQRLLQVTDQTIKRVPEVDRVLGKAGRADTATDPAPLSMLETLIILKPESEWRSVDTWYSGWAPEWARSVLRKITPDRITKAELINLLDSMLQVPGVANSWTMPIRGRVDMLATGIRTPVGAKITGPDLRVIEQICARAEEALRGVAGMRGSFCERTTTGRYIDVEWDRPALARYGVGLEDAQTAIQGAVGGENVATTIEGRERYPVNVRYLGDFRSDLHALSRIRLPVQGGTGGVQLGQVAAVRVATGPAMVRNENGILTAYLYIDLGDRDPGTFIEDASRVLAASMAVPSGYQLTWSGQYEAMSRVADRLWVVIPLTLLAVFTLLVISTRSMLKTCIVLLAVPFSAIGAMWFLYLAGYHMSTATWVGLIALLGVDAGTAVLMLLYIDLAVAEADGRRQLANLADLRGAIVRGSANRLRPKLMTVAAMLFGLVPIMWASGAGADVMKRIAAPMIGGILSSFMLELLVYPALYELWRRGTLLERTSSSEASSAF